MTGIISMGETIKELQRIWVKIGDEDMLGRKAINDAIMFLDYLEALQKTGRIVERK